MTLIRSLAPSALHLSAAAAFAALITGCGSVSEIEADAAGGNGQDPDAGAGASDANPGADDASEPPADADDTVEFPDDPILFLPFSDSSFEDRSGEGHSMSSSIAQPAFAADRFGFADRAIDLTENFGNDWDMALATSNPLGLSGEITMAAWIRGNSNGNDERIVGQGEWFTLMFASSSTVRFGLVDGIFADEPGVVDPGTHDSEVWTLYVGVVEIDGGDTTLKLYRDGNLVASDTITGAFPPPEDCRVYIGNFEGGGNQCSELDRPNRLNAFVDDVRVYDRALSDEEIELLYTDGGWPPS